MVEVNLTASNSLLIPLLKYSAPTRVMIVATLFAYRRTAIMTMYLKCLEMSSKKGKVIKIKNAKYV